MPARSTLVRRPSVYDAMRSKGYTSAKSVKIANARGWRATYDALTTTREVPREVKAIPAEVRRVWTIAFTRALSESPEDLAGDLAMAKVKKLFTQEGDTWVAKKEGGGFDPETGKPIDPDDPNAKVDPETGEPIDPEAEAEIDPETGEPVDPLMADPYAEEGEEEDDPLMADPYAEEGEEEVAVEGEEMMEEEEAVIDPVAQAEGEAYEAEEVTAMLRARAKHRSRYAAKMAANGDSMFVDTFMIDSKALRVTNDGYLVTSPRVARTGIQLYKGWEVGKPQMDTVRVYRPEKEVFNHVAMTSLAHRPITLDHPDTAVNATNWRQLAVGKSDGDVARDGDFIRVPLVLMDAHAIKEAQSGRSQLSVGYGAKLIWGKGESPNGEIYDAMQTEIRANHIALVSAARGGDKLRIGDACAECGTGGGKCGCDGKTKTKVKVKGNQDGHHKRRTTMAERTLDGVTIELEDRDAQVLDRHLSVLNKRIHAQDVDVEAIKAQIAELQAQLAAAQKGVGAKDGEIAVLKQEVADSKLTPEMLDKALNVRMEVVDRATSFFGDAKYPWAGKADAQIKRDVVTARLGDVKTKTMNDDEIGGAFLTITEPVQANDMQRLTQSFSKPPAGNYSDAAARAYDKRNEELANRFKKNRKPFGATT